MNLFFTSTDPAQPGQGSATVILGVGSSPPPVITSVVNSASQLPVLAGGEYVTIYGTNLGTGPVSLAPSYFTTYAGIASTSARQPFSFEPLSNVLPSGNATVVTFAGLPAPLLYVSPTQIKVIIYLT
jgi:uncharacterized protein (TIGR03437 family)